MTHCSVYVVEEIDQALFHDSFYSSEASAIILREPEALGERPQRGDALTRARCLRPAYFGNRVIPRCHLTGRSHVLTCAFAAD
jgi:hypothetical protein